MTLCAQENFWKGSAVIREIKARVLPLAEHLLRFHPEQRNLRVHRADYDALERWHKAASVAGFHRSAASGEIRFRGLVLFPDGGAPWHPRGPSVPAQSVIE